MAKDKKRMRKIRIKRIKSIKKQIEKHQKKIDHLDGRKDTTKEYWKKEIDKSFLNQIDRDKNYLGEK